MLGEMRGEDVEVAAVARQPMHADDDMVLARVAPFVNGDAMESMRIEGEKAVPVQFQQNRDRPLVIARPGTNLAAEDPIRPRRISDDHRQQKKRADEEKRLRAGCGGRIPQTD